MRTHEWLGGDIPLPAVLVDGEGAILDANGPALAYFRLDSDPRGMPLADILPDAVAPLFLYYYLNASEQKPYLFTAAEGEPQTPTGFLVTPLAGADGAFLGAMLVVCPVTGEEGRSLGQNDLLGRKGPSFPPPAATGTLFRERDGRDGAEARAAAVLLDDAVLDQAIGTPPAKEPTANPIAATEKEPATDTERKKALLVEDNQVIRKIAGKIVEQLGLDVDFAVNGAEAVEKCRAKRYDIILMDMFMPVMNGDEATRLIRALPPPFGEIPILAVTASDSGEERESMVKAGVTAFLPKPFTVEQAKDALRPLL